MSFRLVPKSVTLNDLERRNGVISANSGSFRAHCVNVHVRYLIAISVLVSLNSPLSPSITPSLFHSRLKTYLCHKPSGPRTDPTDFITDCLFWASLFFCF